MWVLHFLKLCLLGKNISTEPERKFVSPHRNRKNKETISIKLGNKAIRGEKRGRWWVAKSSIYWESSTSLISWNASGKIIWWKPPTQANLDRFCSTTLVWKSHLKWNMQTYPGKIKIVNLKMRKITHKMKTEPQECSLRYGPQEVRSPRNWDLRNFHLIQSL